MILRMKNYHLEVKRFILTYVCSAKVSRTVEDPTEASQIFGTGRVSAGHCCLLIWWSFDRRLDNQLFQQSIHGEFRALLYALAALSLVGCVVAISARSRRPPPNIKSVQTTTDWGL